ncbi:hypothetical protein CTEN210_04127 [Chaetoceros tenuissimus]|uniref:Uncharacterized protein n=1 Tax=Chaetoceros tenuissimus TaxID=426638 RepID=A0AAD3CKA7_9STRA|nr:hypothetical protein CTEN210_04127 [Chaetoceros tenuissimus]
MNKLIKLLIIAVMVTSSFLHIVVSNMDKNQIVIPIDCNDNSQQVQPTAINSIYNNATIIVLSSLIPTHPSIYMIEKTITSIRNMIQGLSNPKIIISIDGLPPEKQINENFDRLQNYTHALRKRYHNDISIQILTQYKNLHINNCIRNALEYVDTKYVYIMQHDFEMVRIVNHTEIIDAMENDPDTLQIVRFDKGVGKGKLRNYHAVLKQRGCHDRWYKNGTKFVMGRWSDNNHLTTKDYYERVFRKIGSVSRPLEHFFLDTRRWPDLDCYFGNQWMYDWDPKNPFLHHLDGRNTEVIQS